MSKKTLYFESIGGASGDMILGALIGLGVPAKELNEELKLLKIDPFEIVADQVVEQGMSGLRARVKLLEQPHLDDTEDNPHHGRHLCAILEQINGSALPEPVKHRSSAVFQHIGEAEAAVHNVEIEKIHFHEVGAMDSIIDIIGCCLAFHKLGVGGVALRSLPQGHGVIECAHGTYPNPAPATLRLLHEGGVPCELVNEPFELVTPTGAALLSDWRTAEFPPSGSRAVKSAYSFGHHTLNDRPNLLRATLYETTEICAADECLVMESSLDDMTPELAGCLFEQLLEAGALEVFTTPLFMKKQRPGILLTVLCHPHERDEMLDIIFRESTTFGVRERLEKRTVLERNFRMAATPFGRVCMKIGMYRGNVVTVSPEMEDCRRLAREHGISVKAVYRAASASLLQ